MSLRDRFFTRKVATAITSPSGILLAGAGVSVGVVAGLPVLAAAGIGVAAWGVRVALAIPRTEKGPRIDPLALKEPWRRYVWEARKDQRRYQEAIARVPEGPLRQRLTGLGSRIETAVTECWQVAKAGQDLVEARKAVDASGAESDLARLGGPEVAAQHPPDSQLGRTVAAIQAQLDTARRMDATIEQLHARLSLLDARLGEAVSRAIELSVRSGSESISGLGGLDADVGSLVGELEALRLALDETSPGALAAGTTSFPAEGGAVRLPGPDVPTSTAPPTPAEAPRSAPPAAPATPPTAAPAPPPSPPGATPDAGRPNGRTSPPDEGRPAPGVG